MGSKMEDKLQPQASLFEEERDPDAKDERRLLDLFRLMQYPDRSSLLHELSMRVLIELSKSAVPSSDFPIMLPREEDEADPREFAEEFLADIKPDQEPAHSLRDELVSALNDAWNGSFAYEILGSAKYDEWRAVDLLSTLQAYAENAGRPAPPFGEDEMKAFIVNWRSNFMDALERLKISSEFDCNSDDADGRPISKNLDQKAMPEQAESNLASNVASPTTCVLKRGGDIFRISFTMWAEALALALRFKWSPPGTSTSYLATGFHVSSENAMALSNAFDRIFAMAIHDPVQFYPVRIDMGQLYLLKEFVEGGEFEVGDE